MRSFPFPEKTMLEETSCGCVKKNAEGQIIALHQVNKENAQTTIII